MVKQAFAISVNLAEVSPHDLHPWLDENAPGWSVISVTDHNSAVSFGSDNPVTPREEIELIFDKISRLKASMGFDVESNRPVYKLIEANHVMLARLTWPVTEVNPITHLPVLEK